MTKLDESAPIPIVANSDERASVIIVSLVLLVLDVLVFAGIAVHTMLCRRKYGKYIDDMELIDLSMPVQFFMLTPGPIYAAGFLLVVVALILKECAIDRKAISRTRKPSAITVKITRPSLFPIPVARST